MRGRVMRRFVRTRLAPAMKPIIAAAGIAAALYLAAANDGSGWNGSKPDATRTATGRDATPVAGKL
jgi:hypothetical protein